MSTPAKSLAHAARQVAVRRYGSAVGDAADSVVIEEPLQIRLRWPGAERDVAVTMRTPGHDAELALGFLLTEGILTPADTVLGTDVQTSADGQAVVVRLAATPTGSAVIERNFFISSSCGICGKTALQAVSASRPWPRDSGRGFALEAGALLLLPAALLDRQAVFAGTGSLHAAAGFSSAGELLRVYEDVGRHNAVDKIIGAAFSAGELPLAQSGLFVSGRAGFELVQKAVMAGCPMLVAVGAPSSLAIELAWEAGLTLVGFLRDGRFNVYTFPDRIT